MFTLSKTFEYILKQQICDFISSRNLLSPNQSGFRAKHSISTALLKVTNDIRRSIDKRLATVLLLLYLSKPFEPVDYNILCNKLVTNSERSN